MNRITFVAASAVVVAATAASVGFMAWNRSADRPDVVTLTERELALPFADPENTGLWLEVRWQNPPRDLNAADAERVARRDRTALESLGFDCSLPLADATARDHFRRMLARSGFVVFEYDGESWRAFAEQVARGAMDAQVPARAVSPGQGPPADSADRIRRERMAGSRLIPVDAGADARDLRQRYPDTRRFLVVPALIRIDLVEPTTEAPGRLAFRVVSPQPPVIHVPREHRALLDPLARNRREPADRWTTNDAQPRYEVTVAYGRSHEPWITGVRLLPAATEPVAR